MYKNILTKIAEFPRVLRTKLFITVDLILLLIGSAYLSIFPSYFTLCIVSFASFLSSSFILQIYKIRIRYLTGYSLAPFLSVALLNTFAVFLCLWYMEEIFIFTLLMAYFLSVLTLLVAIRFLIRELIRVTFSEEKTRVGIWGANEECMQLVNALFGLKRIQVAAIFDPERKDVNLRLSNTKVYSPEEMEVVCKQEKISTILLIPNVVSDIKLLFNSALKLNLSVKKVDNIETLLRAAKTDGKYSHPDAFFKSVDLSDLLGREDRKIPLPDKTEITNRVVLVTGAGGSIGSELCRQIMKLSPRKLIMLDNSEYNLYKIDQEARKSIATDGVQIELSPLLLSVTDKASLRHLFATEEIDFVYHAAAYKHVPLVEENPISAIQNNVIGTKNVLENALAFKAKKFVLVSTDKAVRPTNIMGSTKRLAELICLEKAQIQKETVVSMVRFGNVLGSSGSVIPLFLEQINSGGPLTVTDRDVTRYFMTIREAALLVLHAGFLSTGGEVFLLDMGKPVKIIDLAKIMINLCGKQAVMIDGATQPANLTNEQVGIEVVGLRPGEKLFEELLVDPTFAEETIHPKIFLANEVNHLREDISLTVDKLDKFSLESDKNKIKQALMELEIGYNVTDKSEL